MKLPELRRLSEAHNLEALRAAEAALLEGEALPFEVKGEDEGEQLTHLMGAIWILEAVAKGQDPKDALRAFVQRVRDSIS